MSLDSLRNIYCIGRNYADHIKELGNQPSEEPLVFLKSTTSLRAYHDPKPGAFAEETFHYEAEVVVAIERGFSLGEQATWDDVTKATLGLDLTRRQRQSELKSNGQPWTLAKSFAGSAILGDFAKVTAEVAKGLEFSFKLNGDLKQSGCVKGMIWSIPELLTYLNSFSPLQKNDLVFTGTPAGVGPMKYGDSYELSSPQLGVFAGTL